MIILPTNRCNSYVFLCEKQKFPVQCTRDYLPLWISSGKEIPRIASNVCYVHHHLHTRVRWQILLPLPLTSSTQITCSVTPILTMLIPRRVRSRNAVQIQVCMRLMSWGRSCFLSSWSTAVSITACSWSRAFSKIWSLITRETRKRGPKLVAHTQSGIIAAPPAGTGSRPSTPAGPRRTQSSSRTSRLEPSPAGQFRSWVGHLPYKIVHQIVFWVCLPLKHD